jgi:hypothetical protein
MLTDGTWEHWACHFQPADSETAAQNDYFCSARQKIISDSAITQNEAVRGRDRVLWITLHLGDVAAAWVVRCCRVA